MTENNLKRLGDYIRPVDVRNRDLGVTRLLGLSVSKEFIPSIANTIGTDMSSYKIVAPGQFVYIADTSRRGDKIAIALLHEGEERSLVSAIYTVFEVIDKNALEPEYLMMWFRRPEFDRYARFKSHGSAREVFDWDEMCEVLVPIPSIEKQREIVAEYNTLQTRIETNKKLIATLEQTAQTLYKHTFVDNIDPNNLPDGWRMGTLGEIAEFGNGKLTELCDGEYPVYGGNGIVGFTNDFNAENVIVIGRVGVNCGCLYLEPNKCWINDNAIKGFPQNCSIEFLYWHMNSLNLNEQSEGSSQPLITQGILNSQECVIPSADAVSFFTKSVKFMMETCRLKQKEIQTLAQMQTLLLSKMGAI